MRNTLKATTLESRLPLLAVEHRCIISKDADITVAFEVALPELFTVTSQEYEAMHGAWCKAIKVLPHFSVLHKQDWFVSERYKPVSQMLPVPDKDHEGTGASAEQLLHSLPWAYHPEGTQPRDGCQVHGKCRAIRAYYQ